MGSERSGPLSQMKNESESESESKSESESEIEWRGESDRTDGKK
jgi:hypothetical protein